MTDSLFLSDLNRALDEAGLRVGVREGRLKIRGRREALSPALMQAIHDHSTALWRKAMSDQYAPLLIDLWGDDVIGPLACWLLFEVDPLPVNTWIAPGLYVDRALYRRIKEGIETGPRFQNKAHLRQALLALYDYIESDGGGRFMLLFRKGQWVRTPKGEGQVLQAFAHQITVHIADKAFHFAPEDLRPIEAML